MWVVNIDVFIFNLVRFCFNYFIFRARKHDAFFRPKAFFKIVTVQTFWARPAAWQDSMIHNFWSGWTKTISSRTCSRNFSDPALKNGFWMYRVLLANVLIWPRSRNWRSWVTCGRLEKWERNSFKTKRFLIQNEYKQLNLAYLGTKFGQCHLKVFPIYFLTHWHLSDDENEMS